jgi:hypothetical protein
MFTIDTFIDPVVKANKQIVDKMVKDANSASAINALIDTQAACARDTFIALTIVGKTLTDGATASLRKVINKDYMEVFKA